MHSPTYQDWKTTSQTLDGDGHSTQIIRLKSRMTGDHRLVAWGARRPYAAEEEGATLLPRGATFRPV